MMFCKWWSELDTGLENEEMCINLNKIEINPTIYFSRTYNYNVDSTQNLSFALFGGFSPNVNWYYKVCHQNLSAINQDIDRECSWWLCYLFLLYCMIFLWVEELGWVKKFLGPGGWSWIIQFWPSEWVGPMDHALRYFVWVNLGHQNNWYFFQ